MFRVIVRHTVERTVPASYSRFHSPYTLPSSVSRKSCICHSYENTGVWGYSSRFGTRHSPPRHSPLYSSSFFSCPCALFCTCAKLNSFIFYRFRTLCEKPPGVGGVPPSSRSCSLFRRAIPTSVPLHYGSRHSPLVITSCPASGSRASGRRRRW